MKSHEKMASAQQCVYAIVGVQCKSQFVFQIAFGHGSRAAPTKPNAH